MTAAAAVDREDVRRILHALAGDVQPLAVLAAVMLDEALRVAASDATDKRLGAYPLEARAWLVYHTFDSRRSQPGYPDLTLVRASDGRLIHVELKRERGTFRPEQVIWLGELREVARERGTEVYTWRPSDWLSGEIERVLR